MEIIMRKPITKIICVATAAISALGITLASGCGSLRSSGVSTEDTTYAQVTSNGGFLVQTGEYVYFVNGVEQKSADNSFGSVVKGSVQRISKSDLSNHNYSSCETVVPLVTYSENYNAGIYVYGDRIYYATPSTAKNSSGEVQYSKLEFKSTSLNGKDTMSDYYYRAADASLDYRYVQVDGTVYLMYACSESLYSESSAVTNIHSVNTSTGTDTVIAYNVSDYEFDSVDPENPYVFYTMSVTNYLGSDNAVKESYNQLYMARADATESLKEYDFSYVKDYDASENPLYINCGSYVFDGIGIIENGNQSGTKVNQFNYNFGSDKEYLINHTGYTYGLSSYKNGRLTFTGTQNGDSNGSLYSITVDALDADNNGKTDESWDAIEANSTLKTNNLLLTVSDGKDYTFVTIGGKEKVLYAGDNGIEIGEFVGGKLDNSYSITDGGAPTILAVREETTATEDGEGTETAQYLYYSLTGGNGYTFYRIAIDGEQTAYKPNELPYKDVYKYSEVRILDLDASSGWYLPEFVNNQIVFASETEGYEDYNYVMACDLTSADGDMMSNAEIKAYNEEYEAVAEKIAAYGEEENADGTAAYQYLPDALTYLFHTGDKDYLDELIKAYVDISGKSEEYLYSKASAGIYRDFAAVEGDWAEYAEKTKKVNGSTVYANSRDYYYSVIGKVTDADAESIRDDLRSSYMQEYPEDTSTWWDGLNTAARVWFIIGMCAAGLLVIGGAVALTVWLIKKRKGSTDDDSQDKLKVDITDDKNIDVYGEENAQNGENK
ncbi:MAG: MgtC/SapB family protein [Candidatus Coproplasma sp.]